MQEVPIQELELEGRFSTHLDTEAEQDLFLANRCNNETSDQDHQTIKCQNKALG